MRFLFVSKINEMKEDSIKGSHFFPVDDPYQHKRGTDEAVIAPSVVSEAIGQHLSWLTIGQGDFKHRPVFLFAEEIQVHGFVKPGTNVALEGRIQERDDQQMIFSGEAYVDGKLMQSIKKTLVLFN